MISKSYVVMVDYTPMVEVDNEEVAKDLVDFFDQKVHRGPVSYDEVICLRKPGTYDSNVQREYTGDAVGFDACMRTISNILKED